MNLLRTRQLDSNQGRYENLQLEIKATKKEDIAFNIHFLDPQKVVVQNEIK